MIDIGTLVKFRDGSMGMVIDSHQSDGCNSIAYKIKWFEDGAFGWLSTWQFEVVA